MKNLLTQREELILLLLKRFDFLTRDQINRYFKLGTVRNTNRVLQELAGYVMTIREGYQTIYYLSNRGKEYVECEKVRKKGGHVRHAIMRNDIWFHYNCPTDWKNEIKVSDGYATVVVDSMFTNSLQYHFLEVDHTQQMKRNRQKIDRYIELERNGLLKEKLGHFPTVVWLTTTELRRKQLLEACRDLPITRVFTIEDLQ